MDYVTCDSFVILHSRDKSGLVHAPVPVHVQQPQPHILDAGEEEDEGVCRLPSLSQLSFIDENFHPLLLLAEPQLSCQQTVMVPQHAAAPKQPAAAAGPPCSRSSSVGVSSLAARRGRPPLPVVSVAMEMPPMVDCPPLPLAPTAGVCPPQLEDVPAAVAAAEVSHQGWFVRCRGCSQLTGATYHIGRQAVPFCCACLQRLFLLPSADQGPFEEQLVVIHQAWKKAGQ